MQFFVESTMLMEHKKRPCERSLKISTIIYNVIFGCQAVTLSASDCISSDE